MNTYPFRLIVIAALLSVFGTIRHADAADAIPPLTISSASQGVVLTWFGDDGVTYQLETSVDLLAWTDLGPPLTGTGNFLNVTVPTAGQSQGFFRLKCLFPADTISAVFDPQTGVLTITGDDLANTIAVSRDGAGTFRINNGAVIIAGGVPTVANTILIQIFGGAGSDRISLDESNGALPKANLFGEAGNDMLTGGSGADVLNGGPGEDTLRGMGGADSLLGGDDNDVITGGDGEDIAQMGTGNDRFVWNPGDDTDIVEGGTDTDTTEINGGNGAEVFTTTANGTRVRFDRINPAPFFLDIGACENLVLNANGGNDTSSATGNLAALIQITVDGGAGEDTLLGSNGADRLLGGDDNDFIDGNQGTDTVQLGAGDDVFQWDPGDGSDTIEGEAGHDTLLFNGSGTGEIVDFSAVGTRLRLFRNVGVITMDVAGVETAQLNALGGADAITINDLSATEVTAVNVSLAGPGGTVSDAQFDSVTLHGTSGIDHITAAQIGSAVNITGLKTSVLVVAGDVSDAIAIHAGGGNDTVDASGITTHFALTINGGPGDDTMTGGALGDVLIGGDDHDMLAGGPGSDGLFGGNGDDTFVWNPGDGNDVLEGQAGADELVFHGSDANENLDASANGARLRFSRNVDGVVLDCDDVEKVQVDALAGADSIFIGELASTDVTNLSVDLGATGDAQPDSITINGTQTADAIQLSGSLGAVTVSGLLAAVTVANIEPANDRLTLNALAGEDVVDASALAASVIAFHLNGGLGNDMLIGSQGADAITGGDGDDRIFGRAGDDTLVWNPGDDNDTFEGEAGTDTLQFNGSNVAETIDFSPNGARLRFVRNIANVVMDCDDVETVRFEALGGADLITVNDLSATDVTAVHLNLAAFGGSGDAQADSVLVNATAGNDAATLAAISGNVRLSGLSATLTISGSEGANDRITVNALGGADSVDASGLPAGFIGLIADGGADDDVLTGSAGADTLFGGFGDDVLLGGPGLDVLDGGPGDNVVIQD